MLVVGVSLGARVDMKQRLPEHRAFLGAYAATAGQAASVARLAVRSGLDGIDRELPLPEPFRGDAYGGAELTAIPGSLRAAAQALDESRFMRDALGHDVVDHYVRAARWEQEVHDRQVTDWELFRGFERA